MAKKGDVIENPVIGHKLIFLQTAHETKGALLQFEYFVKPNAPKEPAHLHLTTETRYQVLSGSLTIIQDGIEHTYTAGQTALIPPGSTHRGWNSGPDELHVIGEARPAGNLEEVYTTTFKLAQEGKCNALGVPKNIFQLAVMSVGHDWFFPKGIGAQKVFMKVMAAIGKLLGYQEV
jgi:mannose-6-phosphate isomerase-like protein (cupin superfamily)